VFLVHGAPVLALRSKVPRSELQGTHTKVSCNTFV